MINYADQLSKDLLHTPRRDWPRVIRERVNRTQLSIFCSYCGHVTDARGMTDDERGRALLEHMLGCDKRPELKMLNICVAAAEAVEKFEADGMGEDFGKAMARVKVAVDALKVPVKENS